MIVAVGCDHAGFPLKARVVREIEAAGHTALDCGAFDETPSDYPDFARKIGEAILAGSAERGILVCGSGVGASMAAAKIPGIRAALCADTFSARQGVEDDDLNVLCLGARVVGPEMAAEAVRAFLGARFSGADRHRRRVAKIEAIERDARAGVFDHPPLTTRRRS
jgi:ribose 5-phosphate isomerase B